MNEVTKEIQSMILCYMMFADSIVLVEENIIGYIIGWMSGDQPLKVSDW